MPLPKIPMETQFPLASLEDHHDLATWHRRSEEALQAHYSDLGFIDGMRRLMGLEPLPTQARPEGGGSVGLPRQVLPGEQMRGAGAASPGPSVAYVWPDGSHHPTPPPRPSVAYRWSDGTSRPVPEPEPAAPTDYDRQIQAAQGFMPPGVK